MVAVPSPYNVISFCLIRESAAAVETVYEARLIEELDQVFANVPHDQLSVQWDCAHDMQALDRDALAAAVASGRIPSTADRDPWFAPAKQGIVDRLVRLGNLVPSGVELGYHLCYGSYGGRHFIEPIDMAAMVELSNALIDGLKRRLDFIHMPVPVERDDSAYFEPLRRLKRPASLKLYLGMIHDKDGVAGTMRRHEAASRHCEGFGVSTECGFGRMSPDKVPGILSVHEQVMKALDARSADHG